MPIVYGSPFKLDWRDREAVIAYCKRLGGDSVVIKVAGRDNYNITFRNRVDGAEVIWDGEAKD